MAPRVTDNGDRAGLEAREISAELSSSFRGLGEVGKVSFTGHSASLIRSLNGSFNEPAIPMRLTGWRFVVLLGVAGFMFGNFYFFDQTSATQSAILARTGMSEDTFGVLSSVYSWPNVVLPLIGGMMIDKIGLRASTLIFTAFTLLGSVLFTLGLWGESGTMLILARIVFGAGGESQNICCMVFVVKWFKETNLSFATAIAICVSRIGSVCSFDTQGPLVENFGVVAASGVGTVICAFSLLSAVFAVVFDWRCDKKDTVRGLAVVNESADENIKISDFTKLGRMYALLTISLVTTYVAAFPFLQVMSAPYLKKRFGFEESAADQIASMVNLTSAGLSPFLGLLVDKFGRRPMLLTLSSLMFMIANFGLLIFPVCDGCYSVVSLYVVMGIGLSVYGAVIWPCVPLVVEERFVGTAYGLATALQNFGMAVSPMIITSLHSSSGKWTSAFIYILACVGTGLAAGIAVWVMDSRRDRRLILPKLPESFD